MTANGGSTNAGVIFSFNLATSTYTKLNDFNGANGKNPQYTFFVETSCTTTTYYKDADGDGYGDANSSTDECRNQPAM